MTVVADGRHVTRCLVRRGGYLSGKPSGWWLDQWWDGSVEFCIGPFATMDEAMRAARKTHVGPARRKTRHWWSYITGDRHPDTPATVGVQKDQPGEVR